MHVTYLVVTIMAAMANAYAASLDFVGAESVKTVAVRVQVSQRWMVPLGMLLASGAVGLLAGFAVPALGMAAAIGLVLYLHLRCDRSSTSRRSRFRGSRFLLTARGGGADDEPRQSQPLVSACQRGGI
jgi:hypothetical protein